MIVVTLNETGFSYDVHSLVKAFYSKEDVKVNPGTSPVMGQSLSGAVKNLIKGELVDGIVSEDPGMKQMDDLSRSAVSRYFEVAVDPGSITISSYSNENDRQTKQDCFSTDVSRYEVKNHLKALLYSMLCDLTGRVLPWGNLTGIRPVKIPMALISQGVSPEDACMEMRRHYFVSEKKAALATQIAVRERNILSHLPGRDVYSLYVGIPFCPSICLYCSFSSSPVGAWKNQVDAYLDALCKEVEQTADLFSGKKLCTVYMGGGTPTTLESDQMDRLLSHLEKYFHTEDVPEFTVEAGRPDSITREKLMVLRDHGISRISVNPQTMNQKTLDVIGRKHTVTQTEEAFYLARELGFDNINMDLIVGLPGEGKEEVAYTMERIGRLDPENVTVHSLALKRATRLHLMKDVYEDNSFQTSDEIMDLTADGCLKHGLKPYYLYRQKNMAGNFENVGYAREGKEGLYNILIMEEVQSILALGAGASTKFVLSPDHIERVENVKDIRQYLDRVDEMIRRKRQFVEEHGC